MKDRCHHRNNDKGDFDKVDEETGNEDHQHDNKQEVMGLKAGIHDQPGDVVISSHAAEHEAEGGGADQQNKHHAGQGGGSAHDFTQCLHAELFLPYGEQGCAQGSDGGGFRGGGDAGKNGTKDGKNQKEGEQKSPDNPPIHPRGPKFGKLISGHGRSRFGAECSHDDDPDDIKADQNQARDDRTDKHIADGDIEYAAEQNQDNTGGG